MIRLFALSLPLLLLGGNACAVFTAGHTWPERQLIIKAFSLYQEGGFHNLQLLYLPETREKEVDYLRRELEFLAHPDSVEAHSFIPLGKGEFYLGEMDGKVLPMADFTVCDAATIRSLKTGAPYRAYYLISMHVHFNNEKTSIESLSFLADRVKGCTP